MRLCLRRREFIAGLGGAAAWPLAARAQRGDRVRRIGVLTGPDENDPLVKTYVSAFTQALADLKWTEARNVRFDVRGGGADANRIGARAQELVGLQPDIILATGTPATVAVQRQTRTIPIVFAAVGDPVASGIVPRLDRPGGNITGFSDAEIETAVIGLREPGGGLVVVSDAFTGMHRARIISAAARNNIPAVYGFSYFARDGGLLSYGNDLVDPVRRAATYVDRILRGEKPGDLPVQLPTKFEMVVNRKTATALGLAIPPSIMLRADEVIE
jgi:putative ABC transport system substrate-binding protein